MKHRPLRSLLALGAASVALSASTPAARADGMYVMPRLASAQELSFEMLYGQMSFPGGDLTLIALEGTYRHPITPRFSIFGNGGLAHGRNDAIDGTSLTNLTFGGTYRLSRRAARASGFVLSLSLPTADDDGGGGAMAAAHAGFRIPDPGRFLPSTTTFRVYGDYVISAPKSFAQIEGGLQALFNDGEDDILLRLGLGGGVRLSRRVSLVGELTTMAYFLNGDTGEDFRHTLDVGLRFQLSGGQLGTRLYVPLDESSRDADMLGFGIDLILGL